MSIKRFFAPCPKGLEDLLLSELSHLGMSEVRQTVAGVYFSGTMSDGFKACLWSRLANRVLLHLARSPARQADDVYECAEALPWENYLQPGQTFRVQFTGTGSGIKNTQFGALRVKDAVVDRLRKLRGMRPSVDKQQADLTIHARLSKGQVAISIDLSGDSLHRRGYRTEQGAAPLKENLAAAILMRCGWLDRLESGGALIDPMCGSGTLLIEAALMMLDRAPGLERAFDVERWCVDNRSEFTSLREQARDRYRQALLKTWPEIRGYDADRKVLFAAEANIQRAGVERYVRVSQRPVEELVKPTHTQLQTGLLVTNPPYGERLGEQEQLVPLYRTLGDRCRAEFPGWTLAVLTANVPLGKSLGLRARKRYKLFNGALESELLLIDVNADSFVDAPPQGVSSHAPEVLTEGASMLVNRLQKNKKALQKWCRQQDISCYRLYDADMPEYSAAIDVYRTVNDEVYAHVQEYQAPKSIDERKAQRRFEEIQAAVPKALELSSERISFKQRRRNRGKQQYERQSDHRHSTVVVQEGSARFNVNLWEYLDTGLFLDHRPVRRLLAEQVGGKRFLNLFCYTATATVHAALAGARESVSVDLSKTYLDWAADNFQLNRLSDRHQLVRADCREWLQECRQGFDVILLDPPSFSNSKRMEGVLDIQRDHVALVKRCMDLLAPGGVLFFSNNLRSFTMEPDLEQRFQVENISAATLDPDFKRNPKIHQCWTFRAAQTDQ